MKIFSNDISDIDVQNKEEVITMKGKEIFHWVDKHGNRIDHNPALDNADSQAQSTEIVENDNPPSDNFSGTAVVIPEVQTVQTQIQPQSFVQQNQAFVPVPAVQNVGYGSYNPYAQEYDYSVSPQQIAEIGVDFTTARSLAAKMVKHSVELQNLYLKNIEKERHQFALKQIKTLDFSPQNSSARANNEGDEVTLTPKNIDWRELIKSFIAEKSLVKEIVNSVKVFWIRDTDSERHIIVSEQELKGEFEIFIESKCGFEVEYSTVQFNKAFRQLTRQTPVIEKADLIKLSENELMFANGYLNLVSNKFYPLDDRKYFNKFSILTDYNSTAPNPDVFDAVLDDMFKGKEDSIYLAYQLIGALISPVSTLKRIYVFQGVSNGGKTRLANVIYRLLNGEGIFTFNTVSDITTDELIKQSYSFRLAYIKDCSRQKLKDKQVSYLKSYADGGHLQNSATFKILICTNSPIVTGDNGFLAESLRNRFVTLPFPVAMDNASVEVANFEEYYFEKEKDGIIKKALKAFSEVLQSGGKFAVDYPINAVVEAISEEDDDDGDVEVAQLSVSNAKIKQVVEKIFDFTEDCNLSAKEVFA